MPFSSNTLNASLGRLRDRLAPDTIAAFQLLKIVVAYDKSAWPP